MYEKSKYAKKLIRIRKMNIFSLEMKNFGDKRNRIIDFYNKYPMSYELLRGVPEEDLLDVIWEYVLYSANFQEESSFQRMIDADEKIYTKVFLTYEFLDTIHEYGFEMFGEMIIVKYTDEIIKCLVFFDMLQAKNLLENTLDLFGFDSKKKKGIVFSEEKKIFDENSLLEAEKAQLKSNETQLKRSYNKNMGKLKELVKKEIHFSEPSKLSKFMKKLSRM